MQTVAGKTYRWNIVEGLIDLLAVFALIAGTATTFSVATPLMSEIITEIFHISISRTVLDIVILVITCCIYTYSLLHGFKGISITCKSMYLYVFWIIGVCISYLEDKRVIS